MKKLDQNAIAAAKRIALERAKAISLDLKKTSSTNDSDRCERKLYIPQSNDGTNYVGLLIGPRARTLRELQVKLNCNLQICGKGLAKTGRELNDAPHILIIALNQDIADKAENYFKDLFNSPEKIEMMKQSQSSDLEVFGKSRGMEMVNTGKMTKIIQVPNDMAGSIIGKGGEQIKIFIRQSGAHIQIDNSAENKSKEMRDLTVQGSPEEIKLAEKLVTDFIVDKRGSLGSSGVLASALNYKIKVKLEVPDNKVGLIIGKNGKTIHQIQSKSFVFY